LADESESDPSYDQAAQPIDVEDSEEASAAAADDPEELMCCLPTNEHLKISVGGSA
jgi:hypothetical protein